MSFDADWMRGQSVGIYPVRNSTPEPIISELERIMDSGEGGLSQSLVKLQPIARLNAIMVISSKPALLKTAATWITRLDKSDTAATGVKVYQVRYGDARQIAALLNDIFGGGGGGGASTARPTRSRRAPGVVASIERDAVSSGGLQLPGARNAPGASSAQFAAERHRQSDRWPAVGGGGRAVAAAARTTSWRAAADRSAAAQPRHRRRRVRRAAAEASNQGGAILPGVRITADAVNNTLLIYANQESYRLIEQTLRQLDRPQLQVVDRRDHRGDHAQREPELRRAVLPAERRRRRAAPTRAPALITAGASAILARTLPGFNFLLGPEPSRNLILDALRAVSDVKVLSTPSVVVLDNQVATLAGRRPGAGRDRERDRADRHRRAGGQHHRLSQHRRDPARRAAHQRQRQRAARRRAGDLQRRGGQRRQPDADGVAAPGEELDRGRERPDRAARRPDQRAAGQQPHRPAAHRPARPLGNLLGNTTKVSAAHRADHLHPAADHPRRRRRDARRRGDAHQAARADRHHAIRASSRDRPMSPHLARRPSVGLAGAAGCGVRDWATALAAASAA